MELVPPRQLLGVAAAKKQSADAHDAFCGRAGLGLRLIGGSALSRPDGRQRGHTDYYRSAVDHHAHHLLWEDADNPSIVAANPSSDSSRARPKRAARFIKNCEPWHIKSV
jgi:hypothetical protein